MITISHCAPNDIDDVIQFFDARKDGDLFFYSKATIRRMVLGDSEGRKPYSITLAKCGSDIVGIAIVSSKSKTLSLLFVDSKHRKKGIGRKLYFEARPRQILMKESAIGYFAKIAGGVQR